MKNDNFLSREEVRKKLENKSKDERRKIEEIYEDLGSSEVTSQGEIELTSNQVEKVEELFLKTANGDSALFKGPSKTLRGPSNSSESEGLEPEDQIYILNEFIDIMEEGKSVGEE